MSGQEQLKLKKSKHSGNSGDDTGDENLLNTLPDISRIMKKIERVTNKREVQCSDEGGYCEWSGKCHFEDCPRKV